MTRRELIQKTTLALGYTISGPSILALLNSCDLKHSMSYKPVYFTDEQGLIISDMSEVILPRTKTPGAKDVGVPAFIENYVKEVFTKEQQDKFLADIDVFNKGSIATHFRLFTECTTDSQSQYLQELHNNAQRNTTGASEEWWANGKSDRPFIMIVKELTLLGFFTSKPGASEVLQYNPAPGPYQGCVPLEKVGKAWAT